MHLIRNLLRMLSWHPSRALRAWGAGAFLCLVVAAPVFGQTPTAAGTRVVNVATGRYQLNGLPDETNPDTALFLVGRVGGVVIQPSHNVTAVPGTSITLPHTVRNASNANDIFTLSAVSVSGWTVTLYRDENGNGQLDVIDVVVDQPLALAAGAQAALLLVVEVPSTFAVNATEAVTVKAVSTTDASFNGSVVDLITRQTDLTPPVLQVAKSVNRDAANQGDAVVFTIEYEVTADGGPAVGLVIADALPSTLSYMPNTLRWNDQPVTDAEDWDAGSFNTANNTLLVRAGTAVAGTRGTVTLTARLNETAQQGSDIYNTAKIYESAHPERAVSARAGVVVATQVRPRTASLNLTKQVDKAEAYAGDTLHYTIRFEPTGTRDVSDVLLLDALPAGASYVAGSLVFDGTPATDAEDADAGAFIAATRTLRIRTERAAGTITFRAVLDDTLRAGTVYTNLVGGSYFHADLRRDADAAQVSTTIIRKTASLSLAKRVSTATAQPGDELRYSIDFEATGLGRVDNVLLTDTLASALVYVPGSLTLNGRALTDAADNDEGSFDAATRVLTAALGSLNGGTRGTVEFRARLRDDLGTNTRVNNVARASYRDGETPGSTSSQPTTTNVLRPEFTLTKSVLDRNRAWLDDVVHYRIVVKNTSPSVPLRDVVVVDTLPNGLTFVSATPVATQLQNRALTFELPEIAAGDSAEVLIDARVSEAVTSETLLTNTAYLNVHGGATQSGVDITVMPGDELQLSITLTSDRLEVTQGDIAPLTAEVRNTGFGDLDDVLVELTLPEGTAYVPGSIQGADSVSVVGNRLTVRLSSTLVAGGALRFRYSIAIVSPKGTTLQNASMAIAQNRTVFSNESQLMLRMRRNQAIETHTVIGSVWLDTNNNGRLDDGEQPAAGVDVFSNDGAVARTDAQGKFSFTNMRAGTYVFRADPVTMPKGFRAPTNDDGLVRTRVTGWTSPRVMLPLAPLSAEEQAAIAAQQAEAQPAAVETMSAEDSANARVRVTPARTAEERKDEKARAFVLGEGVEIFGIEDGIVTGSKKAFLGARGEASMPVALFRGDTLLEEQKMRIDGVYDFLGVQLRPGPNMLRVRVQNSFKKERWDSVRVHLSGPPMKLVPAASRLLVPADGTSLITVRVRVLDKWNVPVVNKPLLNVSVDGMTVVTPDAHASAVGNQVQVNEDGWALIQVKAGLKVTKGTMRLSAQNVKVDLPVELVAPALPFMLVGTGEIGIGAAPDAFASITGRGRIDERTSVTVSVDTRKVENNDGSFARSADPLAEGNYPILGDATERRAQTAARATVSARVERGLDFVAFGDIQTGTSPEDNSLTRYARSITGGAAEITTGAFKWSGFGAMTAQSFKQLQIRGRGTSGPYNVDRAIIPGTDRVFVEVRDRDNPQRVKQRQTLLPFVDYQVDYTTGSILLKKPLASMDISGNPLFLVVTAETKGGGEKAGVWGARVQTDVAKLFSKDARGVVIGGSYVHDGQALDAVRLAGLDVKFAPRENVDLRAEVARSEAGDSTGYAGSVQGTVRLWKDVVTLNGRYSRTGDGFGNPSNVALQTVTEDLQLGASLRLARGEVRFEHSAQDFETQGVQRSRTGLTLRQPLAMKTELEARYVQDNAVGSLSGDRQSGAGELKLTWAPSSRMKLWGESRGEMWTEGSNSTGSYVGGGLALQAMQDVWLEGRHLAMRNLDGQGYSVTTIGIKSTMLQGQQAWGNYQITGGIDNATSSAVVGLNNHFAINNNLKVNTLFERRMGISRAPEDDPVRTLPFPQQESDYWSAGLGLEFLPVNKPYRFTAKGENKRGGFENSASALISGDVALGKSFALLSRQEYLRHEPGKNIETNELTYTHKSSIWGLALRPSSSAGLNGLVEFRWVSDSNPRGSKIVDRSGLDERVIGAAELIWSPVKQVELGGRYATRRTTATVFTEGLPDINVRSRANFAAARADLNLFAFAALRTEARLLDEQQSINRAWDVAPTLVLRPVQGIEVSAGHRFGELRDVDFAVNGGEGWFATIGFRLTESSLPGAAAFWRNRIGR